MSAIIKRENVIEEESPKMYTVSETQVQAVRDAAMMENAVYGVGMLRALDMLGLTGKGDSYGGA